MTIEVSEEIFEEISRTADLRRISKSEIVRERLSRTIAMASPAKASLWSKMEDLVIDDASLPTDLSSNKAHLEGYGQSKNS